MIHSTSETESRDDMKVQQKRKVWLEVHLEGP
jgi:hypothetical protein